MNPSVILCIDSKTKNDPRLLNLNEVNLNQDWLKVFTSANKFRNYINSHEEKFEIWVASSDDIEAINLAATAKKDRKNCTVCLISFNLSGSLQSRANAANIDSIISADMLKERFLAKNKSYKLNNENTNVFKLRNIPKVSSSSLKQKKAFILSIVSASGGSGKSSVAAMAGMLAQTAGFKTLVLDADFQFGNIETMFTIDKPIHFDEYLENNDILINYHEKANQPVVLCPPTLPELSDKMISSFPSILSSLKEQFDVIVVNTGSYWNEIQALMLEHDSKSLFLIDQRPSSITAAKKAIELCNRCGIATGSIIFAINKCSKHSLFSSIDISCALQGAHVAEIMDGGLEVDEFLTQGKPIELIKEQNSFAVSIWSVLEGIFPKYLVATKQRTGISEPQHKSKFSPVVQKGFGKWFRKRA